MMPETTNLSIRKLSNGLACCALLFAASSAQSQILLSDNFDSYANQAAFVSAWPTVAGLNIHPGQMVTTNFSSGPNSIAFGVGVTNRNGRTFTESGNPSALSSIRFSFDFYDSSAAASPYRQFSNLQDGAATASGQLVSIGLNNNLTSAAEGGNFYMARILGYNGTGSPFFKLNDVGAPLRTTGWHNLAVEVSTTSFKFFVDGILSETVANIYTLRSYETVRLGSGVSSTTMAGVDNVMVEVIPVPEPSTVALSVIGGLALTVGLIRRRNSK